MANDPLVAALRRLAPEYALDLSEETVERFRRHFELLLTWNRKLNLTRITEPEEAARRHFLECAHLATLVEPPAVVVDVGSGAGFPGLPLACVWPDAEVTLVEPLVKRAVFLKETARWLGLDRVRVVNRPFDPSHVPPGALLTARALDKFRVLLPLLFEAPAATLALFSEPDLLEEARALGDSRDVQLVALPHADRRYIGIYRRL